MKIRMMLLTGLMIATTGILMAADEPKSADPAQGPTMQQMPGRPDLGRRGMPSMEERLKEIQAGRAAAHQQVIDELLAIKKLAEEENAPKTAAAIQAIIDKKNEEYKKGIEQMERQRRQRTEQIQQRMSERQAQKVTEEPKTAPATEAQK
jgi:hypothetical protein